MTTGYWCEMRWLSGNCPLLRKKSLGCSPSSFSLAFLCKHCSYLLTVHFWPLRRNAYNTKVLGCRPLSSLHAYLCALSMSSLEFCPKTTKPRAKIGAPHHPSMTHLRLPKQANEVTRDISKAAALLPHVCACRM